MSVVFNAILIEDVYSTLALFSGKYKVVKQYRSTIPGHISLDEGDIVLLLSSNEPDQLWQGHCLRTGQQGIFPRCHVIKVCHAISLKKALF